MVRKTVQFLWNIRSLGYERTQSVSAGEKTKRRSAMDKLLYPMGEKVIVKKKLFKIKRSEEHVCNTTQEQHISQLFFPNSLTINQHLSGVEENEENK